MSTPTPHNGRLTAGAITTILLASLVLRLPAIPPPAQAQTHLAVLAGTPEAEPGTVQTDQFTSVQFRVLLYGCDETRVERPAQQVAAQHDHLDVGSTGYIRDPVYSPGGLQWVVAADHHTADMTIVGGNSGVALDVVASVSFADVGTHEVQLSGWVLLADSTTLPAAGAAQPTSAVAQVEVVAREVDLQINGRNNVDKGRAPGRPLHINDNFDEVQTNAAGDLVSDHLVNPATGNPQIRTTPADPDLVAGSVTLGPANSVGTLEWTVAPGVRAWWKPGDAWVEVASQGNYTATGATISMYFEGTDIDPAAIEVRFTPNGGAPKSDRVLCTVFTGLGILGDDDPANACMQQIESAGDITLHRNAIGDVWRTGAKAAGVEAFQLTFREYLVVILESQTQTTVLAEPAAETVGGSFANKTIDTADIAAFMTAELREGAAILVHELTEQYQKQVCGKTVYDDAHALALAAEYAVTGATNRQDQVDDNDGLPLHKMTYDLPGGGHLTVTYNTSRFYDYVLNVTVTRDP
jgi:hypothetical protein